MTNTAITLQELEEKLLTLIECDALELILDKTDDSRVYIPYMMNDALEYYFVLEHCMISGPLPHKFPSDTKLQIVSTKYDADKIDTYGLIFRTTDDTVFTIWFSNHRSSCTFYQYHRIGHFWRKGMEHWRRLVYIIGTIHEKYTFLGEHACTPLEKELLPLIEFAPFRYWSPLHEPLDDYYINSRDGILCMKQLAIEVQATAYARMVQFYALLPKTLQSSHWLIAYFAKKLTAPKHNVLYEHLCKKIENASMVYTPRDYGPKHNLQIENIRTQFTKELYADGYIGQYPHFQKGDTILTALEEHPFTILESDSFKFRIHGLCNASNCSYFLYKKG